MLLLLILSYSTVRFSCCESAEDQPRRIQDSVECIRVKKGGGGRFTSGDGCDVEGPGI